MNYGYVRVSSADQNEDRQFMVMQNLTIDRYFSDKCSGKNFNRPAYKRMLKVLKPGDVLFVVSLDRLGRNYKEVRQQWAYLVETLSVDIVVLDMPLLDTRKNGELLNKVISDIILSIMGYFAQIEREMIHARQAEGIAAAKLRGVEFGRPKVNLPENFFDVCALCDSHEITIREGAEYCEMSPTTFYRYYKGLAS